MIREFLNAGEIQRETLVTNCKNGTENPTATFLQLGESDGDAIGRPVRASIRLNLQQRIRELEEALLEERRARQEAEHLIERLERKLQYQDEVLITRPPGQSPCET
jgi:hypothetical protein